MSNKIERYFLNVDMRLSHDGLTRIASDEGYAVETLESGECFLFVNTSFTAFKVLGAGNTFLYHRTAKGRSLDPRAIVAAVERFDGSKLDYKGALRDTLTKRLGAREVSSVDR